VKADTDNPRAKSAQTLAHLYKRRDQDSGGYLWGHRLVFLVLVTPKISIPVGFTFYLRIPVESCHGCRSKPATDSSRRLPLMPMESCQ
jgi:hypothetical protein